MLMVAEMTGSLSILTPAMIAVGISWLIVRRSDDTMYRSQLKSRADAPSQRLLAGLPLLGAIPVARAMAEPRLVLTTQRNIDSARRELVDAGLSEAPVVDEAGRLEGTVARSRLEKPGNRKHELGDLVDAGAPTVSESSRLDVALESLSSARGSWVPVIDAERRVVGTLSISDVVRAYRQELVMSAERMGDLGRTTGAAQVTVTAASPIAGRTLRQSGLPAGLLITSISRGDRTFFPTGDATLAVGDQLTVIGQGFDLTRIGTVVSMGSAD
jgi:CBS domain-containing protein